MPFPARSRARLSAAGQPVRSALAALCCGRRARREAAPAAGAADTKGGGRGAEERRRRARRGRCCPFRRRGERLRARCNRDRNRGLVGRVAMSPGERARRRGLGVPRSPLGNRVDESGLGGAGGPEPRVSVRPWKRGCPAPSLPSPGRPRAFRPPFLNKSRRKKNISAPRPRPPSDPSARALPTPSGMQKRT